MKCKLLKKRRVLRRLENKYTDYLIIRSHVSDFQYYFKCFDNKLKATKKAIKKIKQLSK